MFNEGLAMRDDDGRFDEWFDARSRAPLPRLRAAPFVWRDPTSFPRRQWLYGHHFVRKFVSCTFAPGGVGKSSLALVEAVAMASGRALLGTHPKGGALRVWYWNGEDPLEEIERRVAAILLHFGIMPEELEGRLFLNSGRERDSEIVIARTTRAGTVIYEPVVAAFQAAIVDDGIDVTILDPFVSTHAVTENDNGAMSTVAYAFSGIADRTNSAIDLVHHVRKTGGAEVTVEDGRGAGALLAATRSARVLNGMTKDEADKAGVDRPRSYFRVDNGKLSMAPPPDASTWFRLVGVSLGNGDDHGEDGDSVAVVTPWHWPDPLADVTVADLRAVQAAVAGGRWRENVQARDWVGKAVAGALRLDLATKIDKAKVVRLIRIWLQSGALVIVEGEDEKRNKRSFVEVGEPATD